MIGNKKQKYLFLFMLALAVLSVSILGALAQGKISVESRVDRSKILIGDVIRYTIIITHDPDVHLQTPSLAANLGSFEIRDYKVLEPEKTDDQIVEKTEYLISTFDVGEFEIPPLSIGYTVGDDTTVQVIKTEPIAITVQSLNPDEAGDIRDIKFPLLPPRDYRRLILYGALGFLLLLFIAGLIYYLKRRREGKSLLPTRAQPPRPAHEVALEALAKLAQSDLLAAGQVKQYFSELSDILRQYIEQRFFIYAMEMTTSQLLDTMQKENIEAEYTNILQQILEVCDLVKFAKYIPEEEESSKTTELAFDFVNKTKLVVLEEPQTVAEDEQKVVEEESVREPAEAEGDN